MASYDTSSDTFNDRFTGDKSSPAAPSDNTFNERFSMSSPDDFTSDLAKSPAAQSDYNATYGSIHPSFPSMGREQKATQGSQSVSPYKGPGDAEVSEPSPRTDLGPGRPAQKGYGFAESDVGPKGQRTQTGSRRGPGQHRQGK